MRAIVTQSTGNRYLLYCDNSYFYAYLKGNFRLSHNKETNPIAVGDYVEFELEEEKAIITEIYSRKNYLARKATNLSKKYQTLACNVDLCCIIVTIDFPQTLSSFIDRILISCENYQIPAMIVFNKIDIYGEKEKKNQEKWMDAYQNIGYPCLDISVKEKTNLEILEHHLKNKKSLICGHSGTGKSSLIRELAPEHHPKIQSISTSHQKGRHTTTFTKMYPWSFGGWLIDTPGVKSFGLTLDVEKDKIKDCFLEFSNLKKYCRFQNCFHLKEPYCAVKEALENKKISPWRYENYLNMISDSGDPHRREKWT